MYVDAACIYYNIRTSCLVLIRTAKVLGGGLFLGSLTGSEEDMSQTFLYPHHDNHAVFFFLTCRDWLYWTHFLKHLGTARTHTLQIRMSKHLLSSSISFPHNVCLGRHFSNHMFSYFDSFIPGTMFGWLCVYLVTHSLKFRRQKRECSKQLMCSL